MVDAYSHDVSLVGNPEATESLSAILASERPSDDSVPRGGSLRAAWVADGRPTDVLDRLFADVLSSWVHFNAASACGIRVHAISGASGSGKTLACDVVQAALCLLRANCVWLHTGSMTSLDRLLTSEDVFLTTIWTPERAAMVRAAVAARSDSPRPRVRAVVAITARDLALPSESYAFPPPVATADHALRRRCFRTADVHETIRHALEHLA